MPPRNSLKLRTRGKDDLIYLLSTVFKANPLTIRVLYFISELKARVIGDVHLMMLERKISKNMTNKVLGELARNGICKIVRVRGNGTYNRNNVVYIDNEEILGLLNTIKEWYDAYE